MSRRSFKTILVLIHKYLSLIVQWRLTRGVQEQTEAFKAGFDEILPLSALAVFDERELEVFRLK